MKIIPSIDVMDSKRAEVVGHVVERVLEDADPVKIALRWEELGACMIHLVDIDAALGTGRNNAEVIRRVIRSVEIPVQVAGGIRSRERAEELLSAGASRVVVRLKPCSTEGIGDFSGLGKIVLGMDYIGGGIWRGIGRNVAAGGDEIVSWASAIDDSIGLDGILLTDVGREGSLTGLREETLSILSTLKKTGLELMYAGGVSSLGDILVLREIGVDGIVIGKALYNGLLRLDDLRGIAEN